MPGVNETNLYGPAPIGACLNCSSPTFSTNFLRHDPAGAGRGAIKHHEVGPWLIQLEANMPLVHRLHGGNLLLQNILRGAFVALERELDVFRGNGIAIMESDAIAQHEIVAQPVRRCRPGFGEAGRQFLARHRLHDRVMQRVQDHERRDDPRRLGRVEPGRRQRDMHAPGQLTLRRAFPGEARGNAGKSQRRAARQQIAPADRTRGSPKARRAQSCPDDIVTPPSLLVLLSGPCRAF